VIAGDILFFCVSCYGVFFQCLLSLQWIHQITHWTCSPRRLPPLQKIWKLTHTPDPNRPTRQGSDVNEPTKWGHDPNWPTRHKIFWKLALTRTPHLNRPTRRHHDPNSPTRRRIFLKPILLTLTDPQGKVLTLINQQGGIMILIHPRGGGFFWNPYSWR